MIFADDRVVLAAIGKTLMKLGIRRWYVDGMQQLRADTLVLEELIRERLPNVHGALAAHKFDLLIVSSKWFLCLFTTTLDGEAIKRVWDIMLCDGIEAVFRVALTLLARKEPLILSAKSCDDLIFMFQKGSPMLEKTLCGQLMMLTLWARLAGPNSRGADNRLQARSLQMTRKSK